MITLEITKEQLQESFQKELNDMLSPGNYSNPVKQTLDKILGYSGTMKGILGDKITKFLEEELETPEFQAQLGKSIADEMAKRAVDSLDKSKK